MEFTVITDLEILSERSDEVSFEKDKKKISEVVEVLKNFLLENKDISTISAPQLGYKYRIFCINFNGDIRAFINPIISKSSGLHLSIQTSISAPGRKFLVPVFSQVEGVYQTPIGKIEGNKFEKAGAELFQLMINFLDGVHLADIGLEIDNDFEEASDDEKQSIIEMYIDSLLSRAEALKEDINSDEELKKMSDAISFMTDVQVGKVKVVNPQQNQIDKRIRQKEMLNFLKGKKK